jgi:hypothetical protein
MDRLEAILAQVAADRSPSETTTGSELGLLGGWKGREVAGADR